MTRLQLAQRVRVLELELYAISFGRGRSMKSIAEDAVGRARKVLAPSQQALLDKWAAEDKEFDNKLQPVA